MKNHDCVICSVCGKKYVGRIPRDGDGSIFIPHLHTRKFITDYVSPISGKPIYHKETCPGSWLAGKNV